ncbi:hypothetical protein TASIC1_0007048800 [Trichoderma asperellum]|uniref:Uncharacterized protein n=1 Tax=Trichoderma asperellum TaxID=101201 RepID=A0A6V8QYU3_TRIAP|nr:hypothetical protein TASIC1_0007048800 [Trichoderma asperellum]
MGADDSEKTPVQTPLSIEASLQRDTKESLAGESLVDTEDDFCSNPALTIEAAADHMQGLVQQILSEITAAGIKVPENGIDEIESTAISNWMDQGFMKTETQSDELKEELAELLRLLEIVEKPSKRIKYTPSDIKELKAQAVSRQDKIKASGLYEIQKGLSVTSEKLEAAKEWVAITPKAPTATAAPKSLKSNPKGLSSSRWADKPVENEGKFAGF